MSVADTAAVNPKGIKMPLGNGLIAFPIKGNPVFNNGPDCPILCNWVFSSFKLADEPFEKALRSLETYVLFNNSLCGKLFSSWESPMIFDERFKVTPVSFLSKAGSSL